MIGRDVAGDGLKILSCHLQSLVDSYVIKRRGALTEHHAMKAYWGSGNIAPLIDLGTRWI